MLISIKQIMSLLWIYFLLSVDITETEYQWSSACLHWTDNVSASNKTCTHASTHSKGTHSNIYMFGTTQTEMLSPHKNTRSLVLVHMFHWLSPLPLQTGCQLPKNIHFPTPLNPCTTHFLCTYGNSGQTPAPTLVSLSVHTPAWPMS